MTNTTGFFANTYGANFAQNALLDNGKTVYDAIMSVSGAGRVVAISQAVTALPPDDSRALLPEKHMKVMRIDCEGDVFRLSAYNWRREDSDNPEAGYRIYEIAGAPHGPAYIMSYQP